MFVIILGIFELQRPQVPRRMSHQNPLINAE
jgi:hypothetical protein